MAPAKSHGIIETVRRKPDSRLPDFPQPRSDPFRMIWNDMLLERVASAAELRRAMKAAGLASTEREVEIVDTMENVSRDPAVRVVCERTLRSGEFPFQVSIYLYDGVPADAGTAAAEIVRSVGCRCLMPDESEDPYRMILLTPGKPPEIVDINAEALDEREEYVLTK